MELGTGFAFIGRQERFTFNEEHFMVDLVFYNRLLRCFVLFDLKIGELKHQDIGQMQMYVHYYDRKVKLPEENPTIGIVLCKDKNNAIVEMTLPEDNSQIFASKYETVLPSKESLQKLLQEQMADINGYEANRERPTNKEMSNMTTDIGRVTHIRSVRLSDDGTAVVIIDQTQLPNRTEYLTLTTAEEIWTAINRLQVRGAPAIGILRRIWDLLPGAPDRSDGL